MYYVITKNGVFESEDIKKINSHFNCFLEESEFRACGADFVLKMDDIDIDFVQDKKKMSAIAFNNFFRKDSRPTIYAIVQIILLFMILIVK